MRDKLKKLFYRFASLDIKGKCKKEDSYFCRFSKEITQNNLRMMRSMSIFMLIISIFVIASTFTYFAEVSLRRVYIFIVVLEIVILTLIQLVFKKGISFKACTALTALHLFHMLAIGVYIGVFLCMDETALVFIVILTISSMIFTLPTTLTAIIAALSTLGMIHASFFVKDSYWFESDALNGVSVLIFSILIGLKINQVRAEEAFSRADVIRLNGELKQMSVTDPLTGLHNHRSFLDNYYEMFRMASTQGLHLGVIMMDLDKFKSFNDTYGHVAGDSCLSAVATAIASSVPNGAVACRYGGEEFVVLLNEELCPKAQAIGEKIRKAVEALEIPHIKEKIATNVVTISLGAYVGIPAENQPPMSFVEQADKAMYQSKEQGRNRLTMAPSNPPSA